MAVIFVTSTPAVLLKKFNDAIDQGEKKGKITTWKKQAKDGKILYTHVAAEWTGKASFSADANEKDEKLVFSISYAKHDQDVYAYYHGHLIETFIRHFYEHFTVTRATAQPQKAVKKTA